MFHVAHHGVELAVEKVVSCGPLNCPSLVLGTCRRLTGTSARLRRLGPCIRMRPMTSKNGPCARDATARRPWCGSKRGLKKFTEHLCNDDVGNHHSCCLTQNRRRLGGLFTAQALLQGRPPEGQHAGRSLFAAMNTCFSCALDQFDVAHHVVAWGAVGQFAHDMSRHRHAPEGRARWGRLEFGPRRHSKRRQAGVGQDAGRCRRSAAASASPVRGWALEGGAGAEELPSGAGAPGIVHHALFEFALV